MAVRRVGVQNHGATWECLCDCGKTMVTRSNSLRTGNTTSCGCTRYDHVRTHGMKDSPEYISWSAMRSRCYRTTDKSYDRYGGRGIRVCDEWRDSFEAFIADMGLKPSPDMSIDRIDNDGDYDPSNCRWATHVEQNHNRSNNSWLVIDGVRGLACDWSKVSGICEATINRRALRGWDARRAVYQPARQRVA